MRKILWLSAVVLLVLTGWQGRAQGISVSGKVTTAEEDMGLPGVTVLVKGSTNGTTTAADGSYRLNAADNATLVFSFVGYTSQEVPVSGRSTVNVKLAADVKSLQEVVVVAYGQQTRKAITGSVSAINADQIRSQQIVSATQALQGTAPGVQIVNSSGQPGENPIIRIRGVGSINAASDPLIVVDGVPFQGNINAINPADIESMSVLKDASASALYGSRAANGVIIITTKGGKKGTPEINLYSTFGVSSRAVKEYPFVNSQQMFELGWEALRNEAQIAKLPNPEQYATDNLVDEMRYNPFGIAKPVGLDGKLVAGTPLLWNTDWEKELTNQNAARREVGVNISGGTDKLRYFLSSGYLNQDGYLITSNFDRINTRLNLTSDVRDWLQVGLRSQFVFSNQNSPDQGGTSYSNVVQYIRNMSSIYPVYQRDDQGQVILDEAGQPIWDFGRPNADRAVNVGRNTLQPSNLLASTLLDDRDRRRFTSSINAFAEVRPFEGFRLKTTFGLDRYTLNQMDYENPKFGNGESVNGRLFRRNDLTTSWTWNNMAAYTKEFNGHMIDVMASIEAYNFQFERLDAQKSGFPFGGLKEFNSGAKLEDISGYTDRERILSYLSRAVYSFRDKYFLEGTVRWDGSSRFSPEGNRRWGFFPSLGASWVISEEPFMKAISPISFLKARASYGSLGNNNLNSYFPYQSLYGTGYNDLEYSGIYFTRLANPAISWEKQAAFNAGVDFGLFQDRIRGNVEYYQKNTFDLLFSRPLVLSSGIPAVDENVGNLRNSGVEFSINTVNVKTKDLTWETGFNITTVKNRITKLPAGQEKIRTGSFQREVGKSVYEFYIPTYAGVDAQTGDPLWYKDVLDANGNPTGERTTVNQYANASFYYQGSAIPTWLGGLSSKLTYKNFDLSILFNFSGGNKILDSDYQGLMHGLSGGMGDQMHTDILNRWQKPGDNTDVPRLNRNSTDITSTSSRFLFSGDYARLRNVTLGYNVNLPVKFIKAARVYVQADNYLTLTKAKKGLDPETANASRVPNGTTNNNSSLFKTLSGGINFTF
ncbi:SusC/RagA family TonB-linked outer membrane protein [Tellurirhabdus rosea]|uniref:SusC/RagA family TonB-linked outer membrane protein n=1 Tax=Tellurirhabdus rosea TaxID=2674997 RepID=UPI00225507AD|nr:TonB-dependent receptor [Tellurirhabdus rosea]